MHNWLKRLFALAAPLLLASCIWSPGKFGSDLTLRKDGSFVLDYRGEILFQLPPDNDGPSVWKDSMAQCHRDGSVGWIPDSGVVVDETATPVRPCTPAEIGRAKAQFAQQQAKNAADKRKENEGMMKSLGLPGLDDESNRAFASKLTKYAGWRSVIYRGHGLFDVDYHFEGRATQDFVFPAMPDSNFLLPFIIIRRRSDGSVFVTGPGLVGGLGALAQAAADAHASGQAPPSVAQGRFTIHTDGQLLTNNSEDGTAVDLVGQQVHWDIAPGSSKIPEALVRLQ